MGAPALARLLGVLLGGAPPPDASAVYAAMSERRTALFGPVERICESVSEYERIGVHHLAFISRFGGMGQQVATRTLEALAPLPARSRSRSSA